MHANSDRIREAWLATALLGALLSGCSSTENLEAPGTCVQGRSEQCTCASGAVGVRVCSHDSEYSQCRCDALSAGGSGGTAGEPIAGVAGSPIGGSSGIGGEAAVGGVSTMAGSGGLAGMAGVTGGNAGAGTAGVSGMTAGMTGGSAGVAGIMMSGGMGGASGMAVTGGASGDGSGGMMGPGRDPKPGELYGDCRNNGGCDDGLLCVNDGSSGMQETYCSTSCDALSPISCPPARGGGMVICVFGICVR